MVVSGIDPAQNWANAINTVSMAQGFAECGHDVTIVCFRPDSGVWSQKKLAEHFGHKILMQWVQVPKVFTNRKLDGHWHLGLLALPALLRLRPHLVFSRSYIFPWISSQLGFPTIVESHAYPDNETPPFLRLIKGTAKKAFLGWITGAEILASVYRERGVPEKKVLVLPSGGQLDLFLRPEQLPPSPYSPGGPIITYAGHLYDIKGIPTILGAAAQLPEAQFHLIGGWPEDIERHVNTIRERKLTNVTFHGLKKIADVPRFLWHADILLLPPSGNHPSATWTAPLKLAEYMASETPIVATSIPGVLNWVSDEEVEFVPPDDPDAMVSGIRKILAGGTRVEKRSKACREKAKIYSYKARAETVLKHFCAELDGGL